MHLLSAYYASLKHFELSGVDFYFSAAFTSSNKTHTVSLCVGGGFTQNILPELLFFSSVLKIKTELKPYFFSKRKWLFWNSLKMDFFNFFLEKSFSQNKGAKNGQGKGWHLSNKHGFDDVYVYSWLRRDNECLNILFDR